MSDVATNEALKCFVSDSFGLGPTGSGVLSGKRFVVKDLVSLKGHVSSFGHERWRDSHELSNATAPLVESLLGAGAELVGLTKLDQMAYSLVGNVGESDPPLNPLYPDRFTGGSSSGSAAAVAGGVADFGIGTDTAGSIRVPAASCGLFSIRPTHARIDSTGVIPLAASFDVVGILAPGPALLTEAFRVLDSTPKEASPITKLLFPSDCWDGIADVVKESARRVAQLLAARLGLNVEETTFGAFVSPDVADLFARLQAREIWQTHAAWILAHRQELAPDVQTRLERAEALAAAPPQDQQDDLAAWARYRDAYSQKFPSDSAVLLPVMTSLPPRRDSTPDELLHFRLNAFRYSAPSSLTGSPQVVLPTRDQRSGHTYGFGLLGQRDTDQSILQVLSSAVDEEVVEV